MKEFILMSGPCAIENDEMPFQVAEYIKPICDYLNIEYIFKSSFAKANRTKLSSFTGIDKKTALNILKAVGEEYLIPVITDVHEVHEVDEVADYVSHLQVPAFLCRQTELLLAAGRTGKTINVKKGQFLSPEMMGYAVDKIHSVGTSQVYLCERGTTFGYNDLVVDITAIPRMQKFAPVIMDATHCLQKPNQASGVTSGQGEMIATMCYAAIAAGADGLFIEAHPNPKCAMSDADTQLQLEDIGPILEKCVKIRKAMRD